MARQIVNGDDFVDRDLGEAHGSAPFRFAARHGGGLAGWGDVGQVDPHRDELDRGGLLNASGQQSGLPSSPLPAPGWSGSGRPLRAAELARGAARRRDVEVDYRLAGLTGKRSAQRPEGAEAAGIEAVIADRPGDRRFERRARPEGAARRLREDGSEMLPGNGKVSDCSSREGLAWRCVACRRARGPRLWVSHRPIA